MRKIVGRKIYDTEKSTHIHTATPFFNAVGDDYRESLYLSPNGTYFVVVLWEDGSAKSSLRPLWSENEVALWLEQHNAPESVFATAGIQLEEG